MTVRGKIRPPTSPLPDAQIARKRSKHETKTVRFSSSLEQIFILPVHSVDDPLGDDEETKEGETQWAEVSSASTIRPTAEFTILSSVHGRARRQLREIARFDLQSAIKYGIKTPAMTDRATGAPRWKYTYGNLVYITDETSKKEITSYRQPIDIQKAPLTAEMWTKHFEDKKMLQDEPQLCVSHLIVVIDQSGSMRESDVHGFRNRSQAAYGVLALEYLSEQLQQRIDDAKILEAVTVFEMQSESRPVFHREPLDWILFNKILERQQQAKPRDHGDYTQALVACKDLIFRELEDIDPDDSPIYAVIFLSDGRPSDTEHLHSVMRESLLTFISDQLKSNFEFHAIGLGKSTQDFACLRDMTSVVQARGCKATFSYSQLSGAQLGMAFSSISTSMTATRTEALSGNNAGSGPRQKKDIQLRSKSTPQDERIFRVETRNVSRWRYDYDLDQQDDDFWPWAGLSFKNKTACGFEIESEPFGKGAERLAYMFYEIGPGGKRLGNAMVAKETISISNEDRKVDFHETFCRVQHKSKVLAQKFNAVVARTPTLRPVDESVQLPLIQFLDCYVYEYTAEDGVKCGLLVEDYLHGKFVKYNSNNGYVNKAKKDRLQLVCGEVYMTDFVQAFSHWVYFCTQQKILICDLQGELNQEGVRPKFRLTDPCICSKKVKHSKRQFGRSDMGNRGFRTFRANHVCNNVCKGLGLPAFGSSSTDR
jgi:Alpha-kinase family